MTRGIAPLILGYQAFDKNIDIRGVILNKLGGSRHESKLRDVIEHYTDVRVIGAVHQDARFNIEERHLGLVPGHEDNAASAKIVHLREAVQEQVDLDALIEIARDVPPLPTSTQPIIQPTNSDIPPDVRIGVVKNAAFGFYYPDDLEALANAGATLVDIDNITDSALTDIDGLFIGGGFPETHMQALEANHNFREQLKQAIDDGLPVYAECGGLMYLARSISWKNERHEMVGAIEGDIVMEERPQGRGYAQLQENPQSLWSSPSGNVIPCHEFHYSRFINLDKNARFAFRVLRGTGIDGVNDGYIRNNMLACYIHQRNTRKNHWAQRFVAFVRQTRKLNTQT
jgi:cobyrinic acid a,c-diamide synthase